MSVANDEPGRERPAAPGERRPRLDRRDVFVLIWKTYKASFPYVLLFVLVLLVLTWVLTELIFG